MVYDFRTGKLKLALQYLNHALEIQSNEKEPSGLADIHLNICAVLSQLDKHNEAMHASLNAIIILQDELISADLSSYENLSERTSILAIAYHNLAVELEYLKRVNTDNSILE